MTSPSLRTPTAPWSVPSLLQATPRGKELWRAFERSRTQVFVLTRTEQVSFYGLEAGTVTCWQHSLATGALERAVKERGEAWDALCSFAEQIAADAGIETVRLLGCAPPTPALSLHHSVHDAVIQQRRSSSVGRTASTSDDPTRDHLRDLDREVRSEGR